MKFVPLLIALLSTASLAAADNLPAKTDKLLVLDPMVIRTEPVGSFAIEIGITINPDTKKVDRMFITGVRASSDADEAGLQSGDEILKIDGRSVQEFDAVLRKDSPLGRILRDRDPGDPLNLEIRVRRTQTYTLRAQKSL
jgi:predicted metalloprotease with PDZ domain